VAEAWCERGSLQRVPSHRRRSTVSAPVHGRPPFCAACSTLLRRTWTPGPQRASHADHAPHTPANAQSTATHSSQQVCLLLSAGACITAPAAIDRYLVPAERSAANPPAAVAAVDRRDRRANGWTPGRYTDAYCESSGNNDARTVAYVDNIVRKFLK